jgi:hypothetical protein
MNDGPFRVVTIQPWPTPMVCIALLAAITGCTHVAPYQRGLLAHPAMSSEDPFTTELAEHVQDISEGATGGLSGGGGGCGCN